MKSSKSSLFLMEILICILFFSIASAFCVQLFAKAHLLDQKTGRQNLTVMWTQNLSELWKHYDGNLSLVHAQLTNDYAASADAFCFSKETQTLSLYFNADCQPDADNASYVITLKNNAYNESLRLYTATISFSDGEDTFCEIPLSYHPATERGAVYGK